MCEPLVAKLLQTLVLSVVSSVGVSEVSTSKRRKNKERRFLKEIIFQGSFQLRSHLLVFMVLFLAKHNSTLQPSDVTR